ncbi:MAG: hypothetical protein VX265_00545 [Myxococcota bacterium]|nr:hypothetical protein [Myxococcota bacterium]
MLTLLAMVATAVAGDDPLAAKIQSIEATLGGPVLLCVAGEQAEQATRRILRDLGREDLPVRRVPTMGDPEFEMSRALADGGFPCALRIAPIEGGFDLSLHGECDPSTGSLGPDESASMPATEPQGPVAGAAAHGDVSPAPDAPAVVSPEPSPTLTEGEWAAREARYQRDRLMLVDIPPDPLLPEGVTWEVIDGRGTSLSAHTLTTIAQDGELRLALERELQHSKTASRAMFLTGLGLAVLSPIPLLGVEPGAVSVNQDRAWSTAFLLAAGGLTMSLAQSPRKAARSRQQHPALYMDGDLAEDVVLLHNQQLYGSLALEQRPAEDPVDARAGGATTPKTDPSPPAPATAVETDGAAAPAEGIAPAPGTIPPTSAPVEPATTHAVPAATGGGEEDQSDR